MKEVSVLDSAHVSRTLYSVKFFQVADRLAAILPRTVLRLMGRVLGTCYAWIHRSKVTVVQSNLALLKPEPVPHREAVAVYSQFGQALADYFFIGSRRMSESIGLIEDRLGFENLKTASETGKGCLLLTAHLSLFELGGLLMKEFGFPCVAITQSEPSEGLTEWRADYRKRWGVETIEIGSDLFCFVEMAAQLRVGKFVMTLFDRPSRSFSCEVKLPHGSMHCSGGFFLLAQMVRCPVVLATTVLKPNGRYQMQVHKPFYVVGQGTREETVRYYSQMTIEQLVPTLEKYPHQWFQFVPLQPDSHS